jgi:tRNA(Ile)-lysidine synthase
MRLFVQVKRTIDRYQLLNRDDRLIVGVSGGVDSMVLLHLLNAYRKELNLFLIAAYVNHGLRPEESEKEAELVRNESNRLGLPFEYGQFDVREFQRLRGLSLQDAARRLRFHFFRNLVKKNQAQKIALGHNADDQVETVLLRLIRGTGLTGLKGMLPIRQGGVIRPLLEVWRRDIESFALEKKISFVLDSSNLKEDYLRNRLRLSLIPLIEREYQPNLREVIFKTSSFLREENDVLEQMAEENTEKFVRKDKGALVFKFQDYQSLHPAMQWRVLQKIMAKTYGDQMEIEEQGLAINQIYEKLRHPSASFLMDLPNGISLEKRYDEIWVGERKGKVVGPFEVELQSPGRTFIDEIGKEMVIEEIKKDDLTELVSSSPNLVFLADQVLDAPLRVRNFRPGDRFQPLGTKGAQKLKEFFIDHKIPRFERPAIPLLVSGERIAWVVGYRIDERFKITERTKKILKVEIR